MFNIDIASLRDPATLARIKTRMAEAADIIHAFECGTQHAQSDSAYQVHLLHAGTEDQKRAINEAYNLGWDTVRLQRGVNKNAK